LLKGAIYIYSNITEGLENCWQVLNKNRIKMNMKGIILQGSAKSDGNTNKISLLIRDRTGFDIIDLNTKNISGFDYDNKNRDDDFMPLMNAIVDNYETIIFTTPVYWYSMSGTMKTFFDRITDCFKFEKQTGRKLRGKKMAAISCSEGQDETEGLFIPFRKSAEYFGMNYLGDIHTWIEDGIIPEQIKNKLLDFIDNNIKNN
jgi:multimeric flavodoxin WrbA